MTTFKIFLAMVKRDLLIQWRNWSEFIFRVAMLPFILILTYGYLLPRIGILPADFPNQMFPGMLGMSLLVTGIHGTAIPLSMDFNNSREIEDRLQAPVSIYLTAWVKMFVGMIEAWIGALLVLPISLLFMGRQLHITLDFKQWLLLLGILLLGSLTSATLGLLVGTIIKPMQVAAMFPGFLMPIIFSGGIFFTWASLKVVPILQVIFLANPLIYLNEALRHLMLPQVSAMPWWASLTGIIGFTLVMGLLGMQRFGRLAKR